MKHFWLALYNELDYFNAYGLLVLVHDDVSNIISHYVGAASAFFGLDDQIHFLKEILTRSREATQLTDGTFKDFTELTEEQKKSPRFWKSFNSLEEYKKFLKDWCKDKRAIKYDSQRTD